MSAQLLVAGEVVPFDEEMNVEFAEDRRETVDIVKFVLDAAARYAQPIAERLLSIGDRGLKEAIPMNPDTLGDAGPSGPENWDARLRDVDVLITLTAWRSESLDELRGTTLPGTGSGLSVQHEQPAATLPGAREHFGFGDGFSQPAIAGAVTGPRHGEGTLTRLRRWRDGTSTANWSDSSWPSMMVVTS